MRSMPPFGLASAVTGTISTVIKPDSKVQVIVVKDGLVDRRHIRHSGVSEIDTVKTIIDLSRD